MYVESIIQCAAVRYGKVQQEPVGELILDNLHISAVM